jgi:hypothetical protein
MAGLRPDQQDEFVRNTLPVFMKDKWKDLSLDRQYYLVAERFLSEKKMQVSGGQYLQEQIQVRNTGTYEHTHWFGVSKSKIVDLTQTVQVPWAMARVSWAYSIYEDAWQQGPQKILSMIAVRKHAMYNDLMDGMETDFFSKPSGPDQTPAAPYGWAYWFPAPSVGNKAFHQNTNLPAGFTDVAGLNPQTYSQWAPAGFVATNYSQGDFFKKLAECIDKCHYRPPNNYAEIDGGKPNYMLHTTYKVVQKFHDQQVMSNDQFRMDVGRYRNTVLFRGIPVRWEPALTNSNSPVYDSLNQIRGISWKTYKMIFKSGYDRFQHPPMSDMDQPGVRRMFMDSQWNWINTDRRQNFSGYCTEVLN